MQTRMILYKEWKVIGCGYWHIFNNGLYCGHTRSLKAALEAINYGR